VLAAGAQMLVHVSLEFLVVDSANVIARGLLRGTSDVRHAAVVGIATFLTWKSSISARWRFLRSSPKLRYSAGSSFRSDETS
jgi:hypothetical protein